MPPNLGSLTAASNTSPVRTNAERPIPPPTLRTPRVNLVNDSSPKQEILVESLYTFTDLFVGDPLPESEFSHLSVPPFSDRTSRESRQGLAEAYKLTGRFKEALDELLWVWDNSKTNKDNHAVRGSYWLGDIASLGKDYPPALDALRERRNALEVNLKANRRSDSDVADLFTLNRALEEKGRSVQFLDSLPPNSSIRKDLIVRVLPELVEARRYADIAKMYDLDAAYTTAVSAAANDTSRLNPDVAATIQKYAIERFLRLFEIHAGLGETAKAQEIADKMIALYKQTNVLTLLTGAAQRAGNAEVIRYIDLQIDTLGKRQP